MAAFARAITVNFALILASLMFLTVARCMYPLVYRQSDPAYLHTPGHGDFHTSPGDWFGWLSTGCFTKVDEIVFYAGLDQAMLVQFAHLP